MEGMWIYGRIFRQGVVEEGGVGLVIVFIIIIFLCFIITVYDN
jgi:hypothetical protein